MPNSRKGRVKLLDIAQASGVSLTAVSLALSDKPGISQETRVRVLEVARTLGYRFKTAGNHSPARSVKTIGLVVKSGPEDEPHANHFYSPVIAGIESTCRQMGINLMFANLLVDSDNFPLEIPALLEKADVDGILLAGIFVDETLGRILDGNPCPVILVDSYSSTRTYHSVVSDNLQGAYQATEYLIRKGHRRIGFIGGHDGAYPSFRERRVGYRKALADYGMGQGLFADCGNSRGEVAAAATNLIRQDSEITGLVCVNDDTAITAMYALIDLGIRVPQQISIIGFDDIYLAESVVPGLSTMRVNKQSMGRLAVQLLLNQVSQPDSGCVTSVFCPSLVERSSVSQAVPDKNPV